MSVTKENGLPTWHDKAGEEFHVGDLVVPSTKAHLRKAATRVDPYSEIGTTGLRQWGGFVLEEWMHQLAGRRAAWFYREMMDNSPVVGAILFAIEWLARGVDYWVEGDDSEAAEFVESCMHDMSHTWGDFASEALSMLPYGWAFHEITYKRRNGPQDEPIRSFDPGQENAGPYTSEDNSHPAGSEYDDGKIGWRKLPVRAQETLLRWHFDGYSGIQAMEQIDWHGGNHVIPIQKALLFRARPRRNNPEGYSVLRTAATSYTYLKNVQSIEAIGIERDLAGVPIATPPDGIDLFSPGNAQLLARVQEMVTSLRRDEYEGIVMPSADWKLELLSAGGSRLIDTDEVIRRYEQRIATSMLADFVLVGQDAIGSYAMVDIKSDLFGVALDGVLDLFCSVMNRHAIPRLLKLNGMDVTDSPKICHSSAGRVDLQRVGQFLQQISLAGAPIPWSQELMRSLFQEAALPADFSEEEIEEAKEELQPPPIAGSQGNGPQRVAGPGTSQAPHGSGTKPQRTQKGEPANPKKPAAAGVRKAELGDVGQAFKERAEVLAHQLEREIDAALDRLGDDAASAYLSAVRKAKGPNVRRMVQYVMTNLNLGAWVRNTILPIIRNHAARTTADTQRMVQSEINLEVGVADKDANRIMLQAGSHLDMPDLEPQVRDAIQRVIEQGLANGENPNATAKRIRDLVPAGRFVNAGSAYRSRLIARNETANAQRAAALASYRSNPRIGSVELRDGIYGPPRSDSECMARDGDVVPIEDAEAVHPLHPLCTLSFLPVVS